MRSTRTRSPYFSPNSAIAPKSSASCMPMWRTSAAWLARISALTRRSTSASSAAVIGWKCEKSKRRRSGATSEPFCVHVRAEHLAQRGVQQVGGAVVEHGGAAARGIDLRRRRWSPTRRRADLQPARHGRGTGRRA